QTSKEGEVAMNRLIFLLCLIILVNLMPFPVQAQQQNDMTVIRERLAKLEEGQVQLNKRFDDLTNTMNNRFEDVNRRLDDLMNWLQIMTTVLGLVFIGIFGTLLLMWRKVVTVESQVVEKFRFQEKEKAMIFQDERLRKLEEEIKALKEIVAK
ncbi:hypothetical protein L0128_21100, partial [candidate division KSB1 bacterium]|nr:hypothetical protein [candidate division KSB1 bacterium]